jgi:serine/threonine-protein kinase
MIGRTVGKYRIVERLGRGGMGTVYKAVDETLDREVAIKVLNPDLADVELLKRFRAEAVTLARLNHPSIATIYELYRQDDDLLMVMEFVRGETLHDVCDRVGPMAPPQAAHICIQVLDALAYAHRAGVVHRDLKPANLMLTDRGVLKVMDFGIARVLGGEHLTHGGYMMGTPAYMSPEQVLGREIDGRADLYSVGVLFYRLLTGELPFRADTAIAMAQKQIADAPTPVGHFRPDLPGWCAAVIDRALAKEPERRYQTADEFRSTLASAVRPEPIGEMATRLTPAPPGIERSTELGGLAPTVVIGPTVTEQRPSAAGALSAVATPPSAPAVDAPATLPAVSAATRSAERTTTTVVLGRTHLAALGGVIVALIAGIGVLAFIALRSPSPSETTQGPVPVSAPEAPPAAAPDATSAPTTSVTPAPVAGAPAAVQSGATAGVTASGDRGVATAGSAPGPPASGPAANARSTGSGRGGAGVAGSSRAARGETGPPKEAAVAAPSPAPPPEPPAPPPAPTLPSATFDNVRLLTVNAEGRGREREGLLELAGNQLLVLDPSTRAPLASLAYSAVVSAHYSRSRQPKWRDASGKEIESKVDLGRLGFLRSDRNWLILVTSGEPIILRFEDPALNTTLSAVQERLGMRIQR